MINYGSQVVANACAVLPYRGWEARGDMADAATTGFGMDRHHCAGALDEPAANQVEMLQANRASQIAQLSDNTCPIESESIQKICFGGLRQLSFCV
jgi:hypothetical protein